MATPAMRPSSVNLTIQPGQAGQVVIPTLDATGAALDVSSGYTAASFKFAPSANANPHVAAQDLKADMSFAFSTTGVTASWTAAQATTMSGLLQVLSNQYVLSLSNDAGTTNSAAGQGIATIQTFGGIL